MIGSIYRVRETSGIICTTLRVGRIIISRGQEVLLLHVSDGKSFVLSLKTNRVFMVHCNVSQDSRFEESFLR